MMNYELAFTNAKLHFFGKDKKEITMKDLCAKIHESNILVNGNDENPTAKEIFNYSPTGELYKITQWFIDAALLDGMDLEPLMEEDF